MATYAAPLYHPYGDPEELQLTLEGSTLLEAGIKSSGCAACVHEPGRQLGCCHYAAHWTLADVGLILLHEPDGDTFVRRLLRNGTILQDGVIVKTRPHRDKCRFHRRRHGCTLAAPFRPLHCRLFLCSPEALMPADQLQMFGQYRAAVAVQVEQLMWRMWSMGVRLGVSTLGEIRDAASQSIPQALESEVPKGLGLERACQAAGDGGISNRLMEEGVFAQGIDLSTVPEGAARVPTIVSAAHTKEDRDRVHRAFEKVGKEIGLI